MPRPHMCRCGLVHTCKMSDSKYEGRGGLGDTSVDALPYIDKEYDDPGLKDAVSLIIIITCLWSKV